ncbi:M48 family metallopeptidase [Halobacterium zhouii]|uniref:M48 family metallopeptidase n=1 Tax=Halobacterium zhouii TaxID=2902624 RepID=UPI0032C48927
MAVVGAILFAFYSLAVGVAYLMFGASIVPIAILGSVLLVGVQYKVGKYAALKSVGAEDLSESQYPEIHRRIDELCADMDIDKPDMKVASMGVPNAFAVGRKGAGVVVISTELIQTLEMDELEGVVAHELAHIKNRDVVTMMIGQGIASIVGIAAQFIVLFTGDNDIADFFLAMIVGNLVQFFVMIFVLAISRYREYVADADAKQYTGSGEPLARALEKIQAGNQHAQKSKVDEDVAALCIFGEGKGFLAKIVSTHPPAEKRIQRLRE